MTKKQAPKNPAALLAARWIDQRLSELVGHFTPLVTAVADAFDERHPPGSLDSVDRRRKRQLVAADFATMREATVREVDRLLKLRQGLAERPADVPPVPGRVLSKLAELRAAHESWREQQAAELRRFEDELEYAQECSRCLHDGDERPSRAEYGLDDDEHVAEDDE